MSIDHTPPPAFLTTHAALPPAPTSITIRPNASSSTSEDATQAAHGFWGGSEGSGPSFGDILDIINPLQHIPLVSTIYQKLTGDVPSSGSNILGGLLFGGALGMVGAVANEVVQQETGKDIVSNILSAFDGTSSGTSVASNDASKKQDAALSLLDSASIDPFSPPDDDEKPASLAASVPPATASKAYRNAQDAVLAVFEPEALAAKSANGLY